MDFREFRAFDTHNQIITDDGATSRDAFQLLAELCAIDVPTLLIRGAQRGSSARRPCASREAEGAAADRADDAVGICIGLLREGSVDGVSDSSDKPGVCR